MLSSLPYKYNVWFISTCLKILTYLFLVLASWRCPSRNLPLFRPCFSLTRLWWIFVPSFRRANISWPFWAKKSPHFCQLQRNGSLWPMGFWTGSPLKSSRWISSCSPFYKSNSSTPSISLDTCQLWRQTDLLGSFWRSGNVPNPAARARDRRTTPWSKRRAWRALQWLTLSSDWCNMFCAMYTT